jgi:hypothetical protein
MATVADALKALNFVEFYMSGEPTDSAEFSAMFNLVTDSDEMGTAILADSSEWGTDWTTVSAKLAELNAAEPLKLLREERDKRIAVTDWWALSDLTLDSDRRVYRQALRDITESYSSLDSVVWPNKPA